MSSLLRSVAAKSHSPALGRAASPVVDPAFCGDPDQVDLYHKPRAHAGPASGRRLALLVDDVVITQRITSAALHRAGYQCDLASNGQQAVEMANQTDYQVILMDVQLPVLNGVDATVLIRRNERERRRPHTIIYGLTGSCRDADLERYNEAGMDGCIEKGCIVSRAMHEALAVTKENLQDFVFINARNVQSIKRRHHIDPDSLPDIFMGAMDTDDAKEDRLSHGRAPSDAAGSATTTAPSQTNAPPFIVNRPPSPQNRALLVDDLKITQKITEAALKRSGYACDMASDGETAVKMASDYQYAVILMDVQLPILDGCEATRMIREGEQRGGRPRSVIFGLTASCSEADRRRYADVGMDGCIEKGCVISRAMHEALAMHAEKPSQFIFIDARNAHVGFP
ncbi:Response regulatory domain-containing protein [Plasmodiophora brassicae]|uniref:Response regulatory domain-containing protein n=1 Tax=Plasmodiophora brassicae TaxID=37360 RepID=A0A0G4ISC8_PLABS|nr:hypothetical protein PBRA_006254 [Plasmodiophora brassicae]